ncbi:Nuclear pore complex protein [Sesamum angolense]|uniref:Nuclear pore complex protein n=1 Tax=Sesamum angolense TaxID=2727404 RepID=A0AAE2BW77_9LAMI|nr:Nuclear pore complex protein [Sesamum angolense]
MVAWENEVVMRDVTNAGLVVSDRIGREIAGQVDLEEALEASRYSSHPYSTHPREWPPLVEVVDTWELPPVLIERYNAAGGEGTALCGIFPEIRRAWASVDNSLFLWRFDKWDGQCPEYSGEEQAICAVGLAKTKPGYSEFCDDLTGQEPRIQPTQKSWFLFRVLFLGDETDPYAEVSLQPLPEYTIPSDGVTMTCITCTDRGHIFLAGRDGHVYELQYTTGSSWQKRCRKVCLTAGLGSVISRWVVPNVFKFGAVDPIVEMVVDSERHVLYARTEEMKIQVFSLGPNGDGPLKKVAEERNLITQRESSYGGRQQAGSRAPSRPPKSSIVSISPLSTLESKWLHLVAVLSDGRRMYLSTAPSSGNNNALGGLSGLGANNRPNCLKVVTTRPSPPIGVSGGLAFGALSLAGRSQGDDLSLKIESAYYSSGTLVLSDSSPSAVSSLLIVNRDPSTQSLSSGSLGAGARGSRALRESVSSIPVEGRMLFVADVLPLPDTASIVQSLYSELELCGFHNSWESCEKTSIKLWARGDLSTQHILPRRKVVIFSTMGMMEVVFNRPIDILKRLLESNSPRPLLEDFFNRFGAGEAAAMCLMLAARIVYTEAFISNIVAEKAAEAFEDPRVVGMPQLEGSGALSNTRTAAGGFSMGQVVQEAEPVFSGAHEGLCLCSSRLLLPLWELPVFIIKGGSGTSDAISEDGIITCRLSVGAMHVLEDKIRSLEKFLRSRRNQRRGLYGCVAGLGDVTGSILISTGSDLVAGDRSMVRNLFGSYSRNIDSGEGGSNKRQRLPYSPAELAAMEVRAMECIRQLLLRCGEALFLLQLLSQHLVARLIQSFDANTRQAMVQLTFHQLVCSEEGDRLATRLISALMEYYTGPDGRGTVDDISNRLRDGCPSYYKESDYKFYVAVEYLERAAATSDTEERENLAREAFNNLSKIPESADLQTVCKRFEDLRFYEAVVRLPLQKAQAVDPAGDAFNEQIDAAIREHALSRRMQCYEIVTNALRSLKGEALQKEFGSPIRPITQSVLDQASRKNYICQIIQLGVQSSDRVFHEYLYRTLIDLGLDDELLEYGGPDLVQFLQNAGRDPTHEVRAVSSVTSPISRMGHSRVPVASNQIKYFELLARYYVSKRQHVLAAQILVRLAERRSTEAGDTPTLEQRRQYLSNAVLQAKSASDMDSFNVSARAAIDNGLLDLLEGKLAVLQFQMKIKEELDAVASRLETSPGRSESTTDDLLPNNDYSGEANFVLAVREKAKELSVDLKTITQLYNEYAVPFELWEICLEMLYFASYSGDADSSIVRETWARLIDQALSRGGIAEACAVLKRVGSHVFPGDGAMLPLDTLCLHLEKAAQERVIAGVEPVGDEDIARALLAACKGAIEPVLNTYDQLLSNGAILPSPSLRLRLLRSVLAVLREWAMSIFAQKMGTSAAGASLILGGPFSLGHTTVLNQGVRDKITSAANRYMTEVRRLPLPQNQTEAVYRGFRELEESLLSPFPFERFSAEIINRLSNGISLCFEH